MLSEGKGDSRLKSVLPIRQIPYLHPDHPLDIAMRYIYRYPILPVVSRADVSKLEGAISKEDVLKSYHELGDSLDETED